MSKNRGVVYTKPGEVQVQDIADPKLENPRGQKIEAKGHGGGDQPAIVLNQAMEIIRPAGAIGIPGLYVTEDPGAHDQAAKTGNLSLRLGLGWSKSNSFHTGQTPVLRYNRQLMMALLNGRLSIAKIVNAQAISLEDAPKGYAEFDKGVAAKFVLDPHGLLAKAA